MCPGMDSTMLSLFVLSHIFHCISSLDIILHCFLHFILHISLDIHSLHIALPDIFDITLDITFFLEFDHNEDIAFFGHG